MLSQAQPESLDIHRGNNGIIEKNGKKWNLYATINVNRALKDWVFKAGVANISNNCQSDNRIKVNLKD